MKRDVTVISLRQFESAGGLSDGYSFEDFSCPPNEEVQDFLRKKAVRSLHLGASMTYLVYDLRHLAEEAQTRLPLYVSKKGKTLAASHKDAWRDFLLVSDCLAYGATEEKHERGKTIQAWRSTE